MDLRYPNVFSCMENIYSSRRRKESMDKDSLHLPLDKTPDDFLVL